MMRKSIMVHEFRDLLKKEYKNVYEYMVVEAVEWIADLKDDISKDAVYRLLYDQVYGIGENHGGEEEQK